MSLLNDYRLLELSSEADEQQAKAAYRRLARRYHPDKNPDTDTTERFQQLQTAYQNILSAIRQGHLVKDWHTFDFTRAKENQSTNDDLQHAYVRERQKAYDELKRNTAKYEKIRQEAIRSGRNTLNEKRIKKLYEEAHKASQAQTFFSDALKASRATQKTPDEEIEDFIQYYEPTETYTSPQPQAQALPIPKTTLRAVLQALSYLVFFAMGVLLTLSWQTANKPEVVNEQQAYIEGLYPQYRHGINHTLAQTALLTAPDSQSEVLLMLAPMIDVVVSNVSHSGWLAVRYGDLAGWIPASELGFGSASLAQNLACFGQPGEVPSHGAVIGEHTGSSRLRIMNSLGAQSLLRFESYDGRPPFSIFLHAGQAYAANFIPRGQYRLVLQTGSLYHRGCNQFLFDQTNRVVMDAVEFASTELSLTLSQ